MAEGNSRKQYPSRKNKEKNDHAKPKMNNTEVKLVCSTCNNLYKTKNTLAQHQKKCLAPKSKGESFLKNHQSRQSYDSTNKVLPNTQPLDRTIDEIKYNKTTEEAASSNTSRITYAKIAAMTTPPSSRQQQNNLIRQKPVSYTIQESAQEPTQNVHIVHIHAEAPHPQVSGTTPDTFLDCFNETFDPSTFLENHDTEVKVELPAFATDERILSTPYNNVDGPTFVRTINSIYERSVNWRKNLFLLPNGKAGKSFIKLCTEWIDKFNNNNMYQRIAMKVIMVLPGLMLQKPSIKSKTKDHVKMLEERLKLWNEGNIHAIFKQANTIQKKLQQSKSQRSNEDISRIFSKLMFEGKVSAAMKFLDENAQNSVLPPTDEVISKLQRLHPPPAEVTASALIKGPLQSIDPAHYFDIDEQQILKAANSTKGSGGPSQMDAHQWRRVICSNHFKHEGKELRESLANFAKKIASQIVDPATLEAYVANRLIPLHKNPGEEDIQIRPIGVGEVLRRIVGKTISWSLSEDIQTAAGPLQVSTGLKGGSEAAIHAMKSVFDNEATDGVILVDAENAFNKLNRMVALHNIQFLCPPLATVLINTYRRPARLFIQGGGEITSSEGTTQGDTLAMAFYGISTKPILTSLRIVVPDILQVWFADDATGGGGLKSLHEWWLQIIELGKKYGYHVKSSKSWLILKDPAKCEEAKRLFADSPINITCDGKRHLGAAIGTDAFKEEYVSGMVSQWCTHIKKLTTIAQSQPHAAYAGFIHGEQHKFGYFLRTLEGISDMLKPLDDTINNEFIPALFGTTITDQDRELFSLPSKDGGLGIRPISSNSNRAHHTSVTLTKPLIESILAQSDVLPSADEVKKAKAKADAITTAAASNLKTNVMNTLSAARKRDVEQTARPGASSWLGALPIQSRGLNLNKGEFQDALCLRYEKKLKNLPEKCPCTADFNVVHAMNCHRGGFVNARHDNIKNFDAKLLEAVCNDVEVEPHLQPVPAGVRFKPSVNVSDEARLDFRARGFWRSGQNSFYDVCVTNAESTSQENRTVDAVLRTHETRKKTAYNNRIMEIEQGTFTPIIFTTKGAMGHECEKFHKSLAQKLAKKRGEKYADVMRYIRVKLSFLVLKASLLCLRGTRVKVNEVSLENEDFSFVLNELSG